MTNWEFKIVQFEFPVTTRQRDRYFWVLRMETQYYEDALGKPDLFKNLKQIEMVQGNNPALLRDHVIGMEWNSQIKQYFNDNASLDSFTTSHELAHYIVQQYYPTGKEVNNLVHFAANKGDPYTFYQTKKYYGNLWEWITTRKTYEYYIEFFDIAKILQDAIGIMKMIDEGTAPTGPNKYW